MAKPVLHASRQVVKRSGATLTTTLCGRMSGKSVDGMNIADTPGEVTCKICLLLQAPTPGDTFNRPGDVKTQYAGMKADLTRSIQDAAKIRVVHFPLQANAEDEANGR